MSSLVNGFEIIRHVAANHAEGMSFTDILTATALPRSSAHRILKSLVDQDILAFDADTKTYRGGMPLVTIGAQILSQFDVRRSSRPYLRTLHDEFGHVVTLSIPGENAGIYLDKFEAEDFGLRLHSEIGKSFPLHCTAMGKLYLAYNAAGDVESVLNGELTAFTANTITDPDKLREELQVVRAQGFALDREEISMGLMCIGAPIFDVNGQVMAAVSFTCQPHVYDTIDRADVIAAVKRCAARASLNVAN